MCRTESVRAFLLGMKRRNRCQERQVGVTKESVDERKEGDESTTRMKGRDREMKEKQFLVET